MPATEVEVPSSSRSAGLSNVEAYETVWEYRTFALAQQVKSSEPAAAAPAAEVVTAEEGTDGAAAVAAEAAEAGLLGGC